MKWLKKFETFDFSQTLPVVAKSDITNYYHCDNCNALWKELNHEVNNCKFCNSDEIEELSEEEWYETIGDRLDEDELEDLETEREKETGEFLDLYNLKRGNVN